MLTEFHWNIEGEKINRNNLFESVAMQDFIFRYNIPSPISNSISPSPRSLVGITTPPLAASASTTSIYCLVCGLHSDLSIARLLYANKEVRIDSPAVVTRSLIAIFLFHRVRGRISLS